MDRLSDQYDMNALNLPTHPSPDDFDNFLPWACTQLSVEANIVITRKVLVEYVSATVKPKAKPKPKVPSFSGSSSDIMTSDESISVLMGFAIECPIHIESIYDSSLNLVQIKFLKNQTIPREVMKIIALILPFHKSLYSITINSGLQMETLYEMSKFLTISKITDICLDNTFLIEANYHILLDQGHLKHLSISKCQINDTVVETIASKLVQPYAASKTLSILNLATNRITDEGAIHLANALRSNRQLSYLNLADNMISDKGAIGILNSLAEFPLTEQELQDKRARRMKFLKEKKELILIKIKEVRAGDFDRKGAKRKAAKQFIPVLKKSKLIDSTGDGRSLPSIESFYYDKAESIVDSIMGPFNDPFSPNNTNLKNGVMYCHGNNTLCYLNLAYNNLTYSSIKKLYEVLLTQRLTNRKPKGLVNVMIEGNFLPSKCLELREIDELLESGFSNYKRISAHMRKRTQSSGAATLK